MKKFVYFFILLLCVVFVGCEKQSYVPKFEVVSPNQIECKYTFDKVNNIITVEEYCDYVVIKLSPPPNLKDLSEIKVWFNGEQFKDCNNIYSNGNDIFIKINSSDESLNVLTVKWNKCTKVQDFYINI